jgi:hypothetical protein
MPENINHTDFPLTKIQEQVDGLIKTHPLKENGQAAAIILTDIDIRRHFEGKLPPGEEITEEEINLMLSRFQQSHADELTRARMENIAPMTVKLRLQWNQSQP